VWLPATRNHPQLDARSAAAAAMLVQRSSVCVAVCGLILALLSTTGQSATPSLAHFHVESRSAGRPRHLDDLHAAANDGDLSAPARWMQSDAAESVGRAGDAAANTDRPTDADADAQPTAQRGSPEIISPYETNPIILTTLQDQAEGHASHRRLLTSGPPLPPQVTADVRMGTPPPQAPCHEWDS
jgi:hypothetical protein